VNNTQNRKLSLIKNNNNNEANPQPGEAYAIVRKTNVKKASPYHIAFVIYRDDKINITLEAEADASATYTPHFSFYDTNSKGCTFHHFWSEESIYKDSNTIVLKSIYSASSSIRRTSKRALSGRPPTQSSHDTKRVKHSSKAEGSHSSNNMKAGGSRRSRRRR
jgi:hypothetical protein